MRFYRFPVALYKASHFVNANTGELVKISASMKMIYVHLLTRFEFFTRKLGAEYYESQLKIADSCDCDVKTVQRAMKEFVKHGVITTRLTRVGGKSRTYYLSVNQLILSNEVKEKKVVDSEELPDIMDHLDYTDDFLASIQWG